MKVEAITWNDGSPRALVSGTKDEVLAAFDLSDRPVRIVPDTAAWAVSIAGGDPVYIAAPSGDHAVRYVAVELGVIGSVPFVAALGGQVATGGRVTVEGDTVRVEWEHERRECQSRVCLCGHPDITHETSGKMPCGAPGCPCRRFQETSV